MREASCKAGNSFNARGFGWIWVAPMTACVDCDAATTGVVVSGTNAFTLFASYKRMIRKQDAAQCIIIVIALHELIEWSEQDDAAESLFLIFI